MNIPLPDFALVVLIGPSGSGKSTFARTHFLPTEVISSDFCRGLVSDDENNQAASDDAFAVLHYIAAKRLANRKLTVIDATNVQAAARKPLLDLARQYHALPVAIVLDLPERLCQERNAARPDRTFGRHVIARQRRDLHRSQRALKREGFRRLFTLCSEEEVAAVTINREPLWNDRRTDHGPFDIIGDLHGCYDELVMLLEKLGYVASGEWQAFGALSRAVAGGESTTDANHPVTPSPCHPVSYTHPEGRRVIFLGDLVDRGPQIPQVLALVMGMVAAGQALCVPGNHDVKLMRKLNGRNVQITHGLADSLEQLAQTTPEFQQKVVAFIDGLISHYWLDNGRLVVAHAGMKVEMMGRASGAVRDFALYGETTGEIDDFGLPVRYNWAADYRGQTTIVYGHTPVPTPEWLNRTINIDTGCVFGGALTALRYPENELVAVPALRTYAEPQRPLAPPVATPTALTLQQQQDDLLDISDVTGKRIVNTRLMANITIREENAIPALEVMSRFAVNPKWLLYLPPTMSPCETSKLPAYLEHPAEALAYFRDNGVTQVICEEKHMGSRAVVVIAKEEAAVQRRFGIVNEGIGVCYTRTGRRFFTDDALEAAFLERARNAITAAGLWEELATDWCVLDCELMPWSAKAQELLQVQYAATGAAAQAALQSTLAALTQTTQHNPAAAPLLAHYQERSQMVADYVAAYRRYCWPVTALTDLKLAPFHLLASEGAVHVDKDHRWHLTTLARLAAADPELFQATAYQLVDLTDVASQAAAIAWWEQLTGIGGEGMVVKPLDFVVRGAKGLLQPAVKCRGREYLRIIYGPEYTAPTQIERLRQRGLHAKRGLALREFSLGLEALERFVRREPLRRVHECVFGVLALESEPIDPRL
ncbi:MAG: polynucleotide kinase-phosphatase [Caldilinea sp. CFX5]|nr:polynucleotide kinase-phosphatase [Caldilinea sp. CFX5]